MIKDHHVNRIYASIKDTIRFFCRNRNRKTNYQKEIHTCRISVRVEERTIDKDKIFSKEMGCRERKKEPMHGIIIDSES